MEHSSGRNTVRLDSVNRISDRLLQVQQHCPHAVMRHCIGLGSTLHYHGSAYNAKQNDVLAVSRVGHCCRMAAQTAGCAAKHAFKQCACLQGVHACRRQPHPQIFTKSNALASGQVPLLRKAPAPDMWCVNCEASYLGGRRVGQPRSNPDGSRAAMSGNGDPRPDSLLAYHASGDAAPSSGSSDAAADTADDPTADPRL
jgi:hypothetical protein